MCTREAVLVQHTIGALQEHTRGSVGTEEYYRSYREVVLVL